MKSINPFNNELIKEYQAYSEFEVETILKQVDQDWRNWKNRDVSERAAFMSKVSDKLLENRDEYAKMISLEIGKLVKESRAEVEKCTLLCRYYTEESERILTDRDVETAYTKSYIAYQPIGIVLAIMPWNFPFWQVMRFAVPCLDLAPASGRKTRSEANG